MITQEPKTYEKPNIFYIKSVVIEHPITSHKFFKTKRQAEKASQVGSNSSLYSDTKKSEHFLNEKNVKITKRSHAFARSKS